jgi:hypothetical protein
MRLPPLSRTLVVTGYRLAYFFLRNPQLGIRAGKLAAQIVSVCCHGYR